MTQQTIDLFNYKTSIFQPQYQKTINAKAQKQTPQTIQPTQLNNNPRKPKSNHQKLKYINSDSKPCTHVNQNRLQQSLEYIISNNYKFLNEQRSCSQCSSESFDTLFCDECRTFHCSFRSERHFWDHFTLTHHSTSINLHNFSIYCYHCCSYITLLPTKTSITTSFSQTYPSTKKRINADNQTQNRGHLQKQTTPNLSIERQLEKQSYLFQQMKSVEEPAKEKPNYKKEYQKWIEGHFSENKTKCIQQNSSVFVCIEQSCANKNPFICSVKQCACVKNHKKCNIRNLEVVLDEFRENNQPTDEICEQLECIFIDIIDKVCAVKQSIISQIKQGKANHFFEEQLSPNEDAIEELQKNQLTGEVISKAMMMARDNDIEKLKAILLEQIKENEKVFIKDLHFFANQIENFLFKPASSNMGWERSISHRQMSLDQKSVSSRHRQEKIKFCLMNPSLSQIKGDLIKWQMRISNLQSSVYLGIAYKNILELMNYEFSNQTTITGCYLNDQLGKSWAYKNQQMDKKDKSGIQFKAEDVIEIQLNRYEGVLKFKNLRSKCNSELKIAYLPKFYDGYHICVGMRGGMMVNNLIQLLEPIETAFKNMNF